MQWLKEFELVYLTDWLVTQRGAASSILLQILVLACLHWLATVFLSGAVVVSAVSDAPAFSARPFFGSGAEYFFRFLRLSLLVLGGCILALILLVIGPVGFFLWAIVAALLMVASDVAKVLLVANPTSGPYRTYLTAIGWTVRHALGLGSFYFISLVALAAGFMIYRVADDIIIPHSVAWIGAMVFIQQGLAVLRSAVRVQILAGVAAIWKSAQIIAGDNR